MANQPVPELDSRARAVLRTLIHEYIRMGRPVGSRRLSKLYAENLSAATLRNVMADLEEAGYLRQPHTSAGRVPTPEGYRYYVKSLLRRRRLSGRESAAVLQSLRAEKDPEALMDRASRLLSSATNSIGIVLAPPLSRSTLRHIEFLRLRSDRILVILVAQSGLVQHRLVPVAAAPTQAELDEAARYLVRNFVGLTLAEIRNRLQQLMRQEQARYDRLLRNVVFLGTTTLSESEGEEDAPAQLFLDGASRVAQRMGTDDFDQLTEILEALEEKRRIIEILSYCLQHEDEEPIVTVGLEECVPGMTEWTVIAARFVSDEGSTGTLGVLGPARMEYGRAIGVVDCVARAFNELIRAN